MIKKKKDDIGDSLPILNENEETSWQSEESEEEVVCSSNKNKETEKSKDRNKNKKFKGKRIHPIDSTPNCEAEVSKVSHRFNLRDRRKIKKVWS